MTAADSPDRPAAQPLQPPLPPLPPPLPPPQPLGLSGPLAVLGPLGPAVGELLGALRSRPNDLVPFREIQQQLKLSHMVDRGIREIPLAAIVGSLNRTQDFDRAFLPRDESLHERLRRLRAHTEFAGYAPVELYQVGGAYFVVDGHHRIAVARAVRATAIEAHVWEFPTAVDVEPGDSLDGILAKAGARNFQEATGLSATAEDDFTLTSPAGYDRLLEHIATHQFFLGIDGVCTHTWEEAVASWLATVYRPVVRVIRERRLLDDFPGRTEADLYLWVVDRLHHLRREYGDDSLGPELAVPQRPWWQRWLRWWRRRRPEGSA